MQVSEFVAHIGIVQKEGGFSVNCCLKNDFCRMILCSSLFRVSELDALVELIKVNEDVLLPEALKKMIFDAAGFSRLGQVKGVTDEE